MRPHTFVSLLLLVVAGVQPGGPAGESEPDRVVRLIKQLGDTKFAKREEASKALDAIGEPALDALRKALSDSDPEVRRRAGRILAAVTRRARAAVTKKELEKLQGTWSLVSYQVNGQQIKGEDKDSFFTIKGDRWSLHWDGQFSQGGTVQQIEVKAKYNTIDLPITEGANVGTTALSIYTIEGDLLKYLHCGEPRATEFTTKPGDGRGYSILRRGKPRAARPPEARFVSAAFSTDLIVPESKVAIHRVALTCRPADGETATLTFDPTPPKFDAFGDVVAAGKPSPAVTLAGTLKLVKAEKDRQLYEIRGPKVVSRLSLVVYKDMPTRDGRLLVHGQGGAVRYVIDLERPELRLPPCHPGCFPAGTRVCVPDGTKPIEQVREGDRITTIDARGKPSFVKVTEVFATRNRVLEVRTDGGALVTTATQPVALVGGGFRPAGELKPGDRIWRWADGKRRAVAVQRVSPANREAEVFNLVLGEPMAFVAGGFVVRSKPPAVAAPPAVGAAATEAPANHGRR
jgi:uncharacterized protein (TIGR03067 family)